MTPEEFRDAGHALIDWIADFRAGLPDLAVASAVKPGEIAAAMPLDPPENPDGIESFLADLERIVVPGITHVQHPRFFGWFPANASLSSVLGDLASTGIGALGLSWQSAPALTEVEEVVCDWMRRLTGLSDAWSGVIQDTASTSCLVALLAARERALDHGQAKAGLQGNDRRLVVYTSEQAHASVRKAALLAGFGGDYLRAVPVDSWTQAMRPDALAEMMSEDRAKGLRPAAVVATVGTTATTAIDPLAHILDVVAAQGAGSEKAWVHVDAALAGSAMILPECRRLWDGIEGADSLCWNPHKWLGAALDTSLFYVRDPEHLVRVMGTNPSYLRSDADGAVTQYRDWGIPLGRRFRALKLWALLRFDGIDALQARLRRDMANAGWLADQARGRSPWRVLAPVPLQTVCLRHEPPGLIDERLDEHTLAWAGRINAGGKAFVTPAILDGRWMVRVSVGAEGTERSDVEALWRLMNEVATENL